MSLIKLVLDRQGPLVGWESCVVHQFSNMKTSQLVLKILNDKVKLLNGQQTPHDFVILISRVRLENNTQQLRTSYTYFVVDSNYDQNFYFSVYTNDWSPMKFCFQAVDLVNFLSKYSILFWRHSICASPLFQSPTIWRCPFTAHSLQHHNFIIL